MSLFKLSTGQMAQGNPEDAFTPELTIIPNNTYALGVIEKLEQKKFKEEWYYQVIWKLLNAPLANRIVAQKFYVNNENPGKADRAKEMFMLLHKLSRLPTEYTAFGPTEGDMIKFRGKVCGLLIREWQMNEKEGNFVAELHLPKDFHESVGVKLEPKRESKNTASWTSKIDERNPPFLDDDISF